MYILRSTDNRIILYYNSFLLIDSIEINYNF